jgi:hypothetical protein
MSASTVGALLILSAVLVLVVAIRTMPQRRERSSHPLRDAYVPSDDDERDG